MRLRSPLVRIGMVVILVAAIPGWTNAQEAGREAAEEELRQVVEEIRTTYLEAYNSHDAEAVADFYEQNSSVEYQTDKGLRKVRGNSDIREGLEAGFSRYEDVALDIEVESARFVSPRVIKVNVVSRITDGPPDVPSEMEQTLVIQRKRSGEWRILTIQPTTPADRR